MRWDIFCKVIDNFGDIGVCWRLSADLAARGHAVRLWVDDASALRWMAPGAADGRWPGVQVLPWQASQELGKVNSLPIADVWVEGFGCEIAPEFIAARAQSMGANGQKDLQQPAWINLEYLSAESYVERSHALPSPLLHGPGKGWTKHFFYPGFTEHTGGLLREPDYLQRQRAFDADAKSAWLAQHGVIWCGEQLVSLFCYEPPALGELLQGLANSQVPTQLLVTPGRAQQAVASVWRALGWQETPTLAHGNLTCQVLSHLTQLEFDELLWSCDLNFVRGEDSLARAIWAGKPWVWHIYPQDDSAHVEKLQALLDLAQAPSSLQLAHHAWNATKPVENQPIDLPNWGALPLDCWATCASDLRHKLLQMPDLTTELVDFVAKKS